MTELHIQAHWDPMSTNPLADDIRAITQLHPTQQTAALHGLADRVERYTTDPTEHELTADRLTPEQRTRGATTNREDTDR